MAERVVVMAERVVVMAERVAVPDFWLSIVRPYAVKGKVEVVV